MSFGIDAGAHRTQHATAVHPALTAPLPALAAHAVSTYRQFIIENGQQLKKLPAPKIAQEYYLSGDPYLFNMDSALVRGPGNAEPRTPPCGNLYDVFVNILEDEWVRTAPL